MTPTSADLHALADWLEATGLPNPGTIAGGGTQISWHLPDDQTLAAVMSLAPSDAWEAVTLDATYAISAAHPTLPGVRMTVFVPRYEAEPRERDLSELGVTV